MKFKGLFLALMIFIAILSICAVCAEDNSTADGIEGICEDTIMANESGDEASLSDAFEISADPSEDIYPWSWADYQGRSGPGVTVVVYNKYSNYCPANNMTLYLNGNAVDTISWDVNRSDYSYEWGFIPEDTIWANYNGKSYSVLNLIYPGDEKFNPVNITKSIAVSSVKCNIKNAVVNVAISSDTSGVLTVKANGKTYTKSVKATYESQYSKYAPKSYEFDLKGLLKYGANSIEVTFKDSSKRYSFKDTFKYTSKCLIEITSTIPIEVQYANTKTVSIKAYKTNGKPVGKNQVIKIKIGKKTYKAKTNKKGQATFKIKKLTKKGTYKATVQFKGNKTYKAAKKQVKIIVK